MDVDLLQFEPKHLWKHFDALRKIPRCSGNERAAGDYVTEQAKRLGYEYRRDEVGNIVVRKPASPGKEHAEGVVLQSHLDMVCEKNSDVDFDFSKEAIRLRQEGDWLYAQGTTLGADNGIGVAACLAVMEDQSLVHGPVELLFTIDEETDLTGASRLKPDFVKGRRLLNLDSEEEGVFFIGCAGGADTSFVIPVKKEAAAGRTLSVKVSGLKGGHSGIDIHKNRGNAIKFLGRMLWNAAQKLPLRLVSIHGGNKRNAIPREIEAQVVVPADQVDTFKSILTQVFTELKAEFGSVEKEMSFEVKDAGTAAKEAWDEASTRKVLNVVYALPNGVLKMSADIPDLVETSMNLATIHSKNGEVELGISSRSSINPALEATRQQLKAMAELVGAAVDQPPGYPGWAPNLQSPILATVKTTYREINGTDPEFKAIHAGLECGIIGEKYPGMDMISLGPQIEHPHSPEERVNIPSVKRFWDLLAATLKKLAQ